MRGAAIPPEVRRRVAFSASQFEFPDTAGAQVEHLSKDTARLSRVDWARVTGADAGPTG